MDRLSEIRARVRQLAIKAGVAFEPAPTDRLTGIVQRLDDLATRVGMPWEPPSAPPPTVMVNRPTQPMAYHRGAYPLAGYATPGAIAITIGRDEDQKDEFKAVSAAGGTVLTYLDPVIDNPYGRYHELLHEASDLGPATQLWPGSYQANEWGKLVDFRVGSVLQSKWEPLLRRVISECPHIGGFLLDDVGTRSWFAGVPWDSWSVSYKQAYRDGAVALVTTARKVADEHGLIVVVNGTWGGGTLVTAGGGYPDMARHGCSLADGGMVENHAAAELAYWRDYCLSPQWAADSPITMGAPFMLVTARSKADRDAYVAAGICSHAEAQDDYPAATAPWTGFHPTGLPSKVAAR